MTYTCPLTFHKHSIHPHITISHKPATGLVLPTGKFDHTGDAPTATWTTPTGTNTKTHTPKLRPTEGAAEWVASVRAGRAVRACDPVVSGSGLRAGRQSGASVSYVRERRSAAGTERCEWVLRSQHTPTESRSNPVRAQRTRSRDSLVRFGAIGKRARSERLANVIGSERQACVQDTGYGAVKVQTSE